MKYTTIPGTDLTISQAGLGSTSFGTGIPVEVCHAQLDAFFDHGGTFIDTARVYASWLPGGANASEQTIGAWLKKTGLRDRVVISTKGAHPERSTMHIHRLSHEEITSDLEESLHHLRTDVIDIYWLHRDDVTVPVSDILGTLNEHVQAGKIRYLGASNWSVERIQQANDYAKANGLAGFVANQPMWSLAEPNRDNMPDPTWEILDADGLAYHRKTGMALVAYTSQAKGYFTKLAENRVKDSDSQWYDNPTNAARFERIQALAHKYNVSITAITLAYITSQSFPTAAIIGPRTVAQLEDSLRHIDLTLTPEDVAWLENG